MLSMVYTILIHYIYTYKQHTYKHTIIHTKEQVWYTMYGRLPTEQWDVRKIRVNYKCKGKQRFYHTICIDLLPLWGGDTTIINVLADQGRIQNFAKG